MKEIADGRPEEGGGARVTATGLRGARRTGPRQWSTSRLGLGLALRLPAPTNAQRNCALTANSTERAALLNLTIAFEMGDPLNSPDTPEPHPSHQIVKISKSDPQLPGQLQS